MNAGTIPNDKYRDDNRQSPFRSSRHASSRHLSSGMKHLLITCSLILLTAAGFAQRPLLLYSPDSSLRLEIQTTNRIAYTLYAGQQELMHSPAIDLQLGDRRKLSDALSVTKKKYTAVNETVSVPLAYRSRKIPDHYNQLTITLKQPYSLEFRLYDNGMAYRIGMRLPDTVIIKNETASFSIDGGSAAWFAHIDKRPDQDRFHTSYEGLYKKEILGQIPDTMMTFAPVTLTLPNGYHIALCDANLKDYPGMFLQKTKDGLQGVFAPYPVKEISTKGEFPQSIVSERADYIARTSGTRMLPWRAVLVAKEDVELPMNDLIYLLGDAPAQKDFSWVRSAKGTDEWITGINLFDVPFKAGINTASYKYYIDFAKRFGFTQIMLDAGWSDYQDLFKLNPDLDMPELLRYGKEKGIKLMLWTLCSTLDKQLDSALAQFNRWGVGSIMTDFMDRDDQPMVNFYHRIASACADHHITVMFHGAYSPKGLNRTWPNVITEEGVLGSEWNIWSELPGPEHNVAIAYTRMLSGPLDYEPGILLNAPKEQFRMVGKNPMSQGTRCQQLAMFVVYDSPLQIFSGNISQGFKEPAFMELLGGIPREWDETRVLQGRIGEFIVTARRNGNDWYIAGLNNNTARDIELPLGFLNISGYTFTLCKDGVNAESYGSDYELQQGTLNNKSKITIHMAPGGGFLLRLVQQ